MKYIVAAIIIVVTLSQPKEMRLAFLAMLNWKINTK